MWKEDLAHEAERAWKLMKAQYEQIEPFQNQFESDGYPAKTFFQVPAYERMRYAAEHRQATVLHNQFVHSLYYTGTLKAAFRAMLEIVKFRSDD